jgi:hypothetical protein
MLLFHYLKNFQSSEWIQYGYDIISNHPYPLSSLLTKKQDKNMNENIEKQEDTEKHLLDKLNVGVMLLSLDAT